MSGSDFTFMEMLVRSFYIWGNLFKQIADNNIITRGKFKQERDQALLKCQKR